MVEYGLLAATNTAPLSNRSPLSLENAVVSHRRGEARSRFLAAHLHATGGVWRGGVEKEEPESFSPAGLSRSELANANRTPFIEPMVFAKPSQLRGGTGGRGRG